MKLHLPKRLLTALLAAVLSIGTCHQAKAISITLTSTEKSFSTQNDYNQDGISYSTASGDATGLNNTNLKFDYVCTSAPSDNTPLVYVYSGTTGAYGTHWGISLGSDGNFKGVWGSNYAWNVSPNVSILTQGENTPQTATANIGNGGTKLTIGSSTTENTGLKASTTLITGVHFNTAYVSTIYYTVNSATLTNTDSSWSRTFDTVWINGIATREVDATLVSYGRTEVAFFNKNYLSDHGGDIVVCGGQFWVNAEKDTISVKNNIILGTSSYSEGEWSYGMRLRSDNHAITINGAFTLVENGSLRQHGSKTTTFTNDVSGAAYTLTIGGADNLIMAGNVNLGRMVLEPTRVSNISFSGTDKTVHIGAISGANANISSAAKLIIGEDTADTRTDSAIASLNYSNAELELNGNLSISGRATFSTDAEITGEGNLQFHSGIAGGSTITKTGTGELYLAAGTYNTNLDIQDGTIKLGGTLLFGDTNTFTFGRGMSLIADNLDDFSYTTVSYGNTDGTERESGNGFRRREYQLISGGSLGTDSDFNINVGGVQTTVSAQTGTFNIVDTTTYFLNNGAETVSTVSSMVTGTSATYISIASGATLQGEANASLPHAMQLTGSGTYALANGATTLGTNISLNDNGWTGYVKLTGVAFGGTAPTGLSNAHSFVHLEGTTGYWTRADGNSPKTYNINLHLTDGTYGYAYGQNNGWGGDTRTISGMVTGDGSWGRIENVGSGQTWKFSGDVSGWTGKIFDQFTDTNHHSTYVFSGDYAADSGKTGPMELNMAIENRKRDGSLNTGKMYLELSNTNGFIANKNISVTKLTATSSLTLGEGVTLNLGIGTVVNDNRSSTISSLDASQGHVALNKNVNLTLGSTSATTASHKLGSISGTGSLILAGGTTTLTNAVTIGAGLNLTVNSGATLNLGGTLAGTIGENGSNIIISGSVGVAEGTQLDDTFAHSSTYASTTDRSNSSTSGYLVTKTYTIGTNIATGEGYTAADGIILTQDGTLTYVTNSTDNTTFYVNEDAVWDSTGFEDNTAANYVIASGHTFDVNWANSSVDDMNGKNIVLKEDSTLVNGSASNTTAYDADLGWQQLSSITLQGNASVGGTKQFGLLGGGYDSTNLYLNGHTLTKTGDNNFLIINATINAGVIDINQGNIQIGYNNNRKYTDASETTVNLSGGHLSVYAGDTFKVAGITGDCTTSQLKGAGTLELKGTGTYASSAMLTEGLKLIVNNAGGSQTLRAGKDWTGLSTQGAIALQAGSLTLMLDADATLNKTSITTGEASLYLGGSGTYNLGSYDSSGAPSLNLEFDTSWTGTVAISTSNRGFAFQNLNNLSTPDSWVKLTSSVGYLDGSNTVTNNLILDNGSESFALKLDNGGYSASPDVKFSGSIKGAGDLVYAWKNTDGNATATHTLSGNLAEWKGWFKRDLSIGTHSGSALNTGKEVIVKFTGGGHLFSEDGLGGVKDEQASGKLTVEINAGETPTYFRGSIVDVGNVKVQSKTTFYQAVSATNITVNQDTTFNGEMTADTLSVATGKSITLNGGTAEAQMLHSIGSFNGTVSNLKLGAYTTLSFAKGTETSQKVNTVGSLTTSTGAGISLGDYATLKITDVPAALASEYKNSNNEDVGNNDASSSVSLSITGGTGSVLDLAMDSTDFWQKNNTVTLSQGENSGLTVRISSGYLANSVFGPNTNAVYGDYATTNLGGSALSMAKDTMLVLRKGNRAENFGAGDITLEGTTNLRVYGSVSKDNTRLTNNISGDTLNITNGSEGGSDGGITLTGNLNLTKLSNQARKEVVLSGESMQFGTLVVNSSNGSTTTISGNATANQVSVQQGKLSVTADAELNLGDTATITKAEGKDTASMEKVQLSEEGIASADETKATKGSVADAKVTLAALTEGTSFSIEDVTLTNVNIEAENADDRVNLSGVSATDVQLTKGEFHMLDKPQVGTGGTAINLVEGGDTGLEFSTSLLNGMTLGADASMVVDLGDMSGFTGMSSGKPTFSITLEGFRISDYLAENAGIYFAADSWLGQLLVAQGASQYVKGDTLEAGAQATAGSGSSVSVRYYNSTSSVGTVIIISGLQVPEPTTSTLGLIALTALVSRRRRK